MKRIDDALCQVFSVGATLIPTLKKVPLMTGWASLEQFPIKHYDDLRVSTSHQFGWRPGESKLPDGSQIIVLDVDCKEGKKNGFDTLRSLAQSFGDPGDGLDWFERPVCYTVTPSGGFHIYFRVQTTDREADGFILRRNLVSRLGNPKLGTESIDIFCCKKRQVIAPGSIADDPYNPGKKKAYDWNKVPLSAAPWAPDTLIAILSEAWTLDKVEALEPETTAITGKFDELFKMANYAEKKSEVVDAVVKRYYPNATYESGNWRMGDAEGNPGKSLSISKDGKVKDFATDDSYDLLKLLSGQFFGGNNTLAARELIMLAGLTDPTIGQEARQPTYKQADIRDVGPRPMSQPMPPAMWRKDQVNIDAKGNFKSPLGTIQQLQVLLDYYGIQVKENLMTHEIEIEVIGMSKEGKVGNAAIGVIKSLCKLNHFPAQTELDSYLIAIASENQYHPVKDWIEQTEWDGVDRFPALCDTVEVSTSTFHTAFRDTLIIKWILSAVAALYEPCYYGRGVLTLQGPQGIGKTSWFRSLFPFREWFKDGLLLDPKNKDALDIAISTWVSELGELEATFRKSDIAALKAFLTSDHDKIRFAYERRAETYPRRSVFCATVNQKSFLADMTGSSRFWVIPVTRLNYKHNLDMAQIWAQALAIYRKADKKEVSVWWLSPAEEGRLGESNKEYEELDELQEAIEANYNFEEQRYRFMNASEICSECGIFVTKSVLQRLGAVLDRNGFKRHNSNGKRGFMMPAKVIRSEPNGNYETPWRNNNEQ